MLIPKFNYQPISRETIDGTRKYATPDGERLPSVTTILSATSPPEKVEALNNWKRRMGPKRAQEISTESSGRGTRMHGHLEKYVLSGEFPTPGSNPYSIQANQMAKTIKEQGLVKCSEFWGTEIPLFFPKLFAGTCDLAGIHEGAETILDYKQTNKKKKVEWITDYFIQLLFYGTAHNELHGTNIRKGVILMCSADNEYQEFIIEGADWNKYESMMWARLEQYYLM